MVVIPLVFYIIVRQLIHDLTPSMLSLELNIEYAVHKIQDSKYLINNGDISTWYWTKNQ